MNDNLFSRDKGPAGGSAFSRRRLFGMSAAVGLAAVGAGSLAGCAGSSASQGSDATVADLQRPTQRVTAPPPRNILGANFNGDPKVMTFPELENVRATWIRGFFPMPDADKGNPADQPAIKALLTTSGQGYGTVLSLKFPYFNQAIPTQGSPAMAQAQKRLDAVLQAVLNKIDIITIGNEPFIECEKEERDSPQLNAFYEAMAQHAIAVRGQKFASGCKTRFYMGALNHLDEPSWRTAATDRWMRFVHDTPGINGTDIHPHLPSPGAGKDYLDYILPKLRADQTFLATEFSLVLFYQQHLKDTISADFANRYHLSPATKVWQVINDALNHPFTQQKWDDFLAMSPWFANNKNFMNDQTNAFRRTGKLAVATYGIGQDSAMSKKNFGPTSQPWLLNSMFCQHTVQRAQNGLPGQNTAWTTEFRSLQSS
jgi:hypothetical protein